MRNPKWISQKGRNGFALYRHICTMCTQHTKPSNNSIDLALPGAKWVTLKLSIKCSKINTEYKKWTQKLYTLKKFIELIEIIFFIIGKDYSFNPKLLTLY